MMEGDGENEYSKRLAENVEGFQQKKSSIESHLLELSIIHNSLADQYAYLIKQVSKHRPSLLQNHHLEFSMPPVNDDDALKVEKSKDHEAKISSLEQEVLGLKQKLESLTVENGELKMEIEENIADVSVYVSGSKLEIETVKQELKVSKEFAKTIDDEMCKILAEKIDNQSKHDSEIKEMKATHEKKQKIWKGVKAELEHKLDNKCESYDELSKKMNDQLDILYADKRSQDSLIQQLKNELESVKSQNVGLISSFDNVKKVTGELKLKVVELEAEVGK